jgi:hypothetical protein
VILDTVNKSFAALTKKMQTATTFVGKQLRNPPEAGKGRDDKFNLHLTRIRQGY